MKLIYIKNGLLMLNKESLSKYGSNIIIKCDNNEMYNGNVVEFQKFKVGKEYKGKVVKVYVILDEIPLFVDKTVVTSDLIELNKDNLELYFNDFFDEIKDVCL